MSFSTLFTLVAVLVLLRIFWLKIKAASAHSENFKRLPPKDQLAVLKECLLNNPTEGNLQNLKEFGDRQGLVIEASDYRPFLKKQRELSQKKNALAEDNELFCQESQWLDRLRPLEFEEAQKAKVSRDRETYLLRTLEGIARLYSDESILSELEGLVQEYPKAAELITGYRHLMELRDSSGADDDSLEKLRRAKAAWEAALLQVDAS